MVTRRRHLKAVEIRVRVRVRIRVRIRAALRGSFYAAVNVSIYASIYAFIYLSIHLCFLSFYVRGGGKVGSGKRCEMCALGLYGTGTAGLMATHMPHEGQLEAVEA